MRGTGLLRWLVITSGKRIFSGRRRPPAAHEFFPDGPRGPVEATPPVKLVDPGVEGIRLSCRRADDGSGAMHEQGSQVLAGAFGDAEQDGALTAGVLAWDKPDPSGEVAAVLELRTIADGADGGDDRGGGLGPHPLDTGDPLAVLRRAKHSLDLLVEAGDPEIQVPEQVVEFADRRGQSIKLSRAMRKPALR